MDSIHSSRRQELYNNYINYSDDLKHVLEGQPLLQWIDGSYVTQKAEPNDIDLVTFIDVELIEKAGSKLNQFKYPQSLERYGVDAYLVVRYNRENRKYPLFIGDQMYWKDLFEKTSRSRTGQKHPKGFLEIIY
ncbi:hypothetical protein [Chitinophaga sp. sic0106]|uniref:DUF6932 family protein n=1 Tax=Chitinophaga sp. sic0106 TaxID=2854785 RepID=UPI001C438A85|nr:hypothetical protein [Chitinophaga sp. sic0106]MBV7533721.1 hypothetical protein [Chitinophaga sp. sic0106]